MRLHILYSSYCSWSKVKLIIIMHFLTNVMWCGYHIRPQYYFCCAFEPKFVWRSSLKAGDWAQDCQDLFLDHFLGKINAFLKPKKSKSCPLYQKVLIVFADLQVKFTPQYLIFYNLPRKLNNFATIRSSRGKFEKKKFGWRIWRPKRPTIETKEVYAAENSFSERKMKAWSSGRSPKSSQ